MKKSQLRSELIDIYGVSEVLKVDAHVPLPVGVGSAHPNEGEGVISWDTLKSTLAECRKCRLCETRQNVVFGEGDPHAELMFIGEGPGADEDKSGRPFVGRAGQLLTKMIEAGMQYKRSEVFIANIVKCRPPDNREPFKDEVAECIGYLRTQIEHIKPKVIVCLGATAAEHLLNSGIKISNLRGKFQDYNGVKVMPTYHPAYLLRNESKKKDVWEDLKAVMKVLGKM
ncbi:MAG: uracil-DNA glycosylase [Deferribacteraceae bacterium]|jgi:DNA polymerase|nr:uracil-DNA glycosylase [Deferribacteraceae bacterium]